MALWVYIQLEFIWNRFDVYVKEQRDKLQVASCILKSWNTELNFCWRTWVSVSVSVSMLVTLSVIQRISRYLCMNSYKHRYSSNFLCLRSVFLKLGRVPHCKSFLKVCMQDAGRVLPISDFDERRLQTAKNAVWWLKLVIDTCFEFWVRILARPAILTEMLRGVTPSHHC